MFLSDELAEFDSIMRCLYRSSDPVMGKPYRSFHIEALDFLRETTPENFNVLIGGTAHELSHYIRHRVNHEPLKDQCEKTVDDMVIERGLGKYLLEAKERIREWKPSFKFNGYTPEEIRERIGTKPWYMR